MDVASFRFVLHGRLLRVGCEHLGHHHERLAVLGRVLFRKGYMSAKFKTKFLRLDIVCGFLRHITEPLANQFFFDFQTMLSVDGQLAPAVCRRITSVSCDLLTDDGPTLLDGLGDYGSKVIASSSSSCNAHPRHLWP